MSKFNLGGTLIILGDTLFDADLGQLAGENENVLYTYKVQDPRRFGVAVTDENGRIKRLVEKPQELHLMDNDIRTRGEFQLTDALQMMIEQGCKFRR